MLCDFRMPRVCYNINVFDPLEPFIFSFNEPGLEAA